MTAEQIAVYVLLFALCGAAVCGLIVAGRYFMGRTEVGEEVAKFAASITAENGDVARAQADTDACLELDAVIGELREMGMVR